MQKTLLIHARFAALTLLALCASIASASGPANPKANANSVTVTIGNFTFNPANVEVKAGTHIEFVNQDDVPHTVIGSDPGSPLRSSPLDTEDKYQVVIAQPGTYKYFCSLHPHMVGTIIVK
jgi:plastocyanin